MNMLSRAGVYIVVDGTSLAKIGVTSDFESRLRSLQTGSGRQLRLARFIDGAGVRVERWLHKRFADRRTFGEWFHWSDDMLTVVTPDEFRVPRLIVRRDIRLTLRERVDGAIKNAADMGATARETMLVLCSQLSEEEAQMALDQLCEALRARAAA